MGESRAIISAVAGYVPDTVLSNKDLEKMVDTSDEWISSRTGISERRILKDPEKATSFMGQQVAQQLLEKRNLDPLDIDLLICATVTGDMVFPDTATTINHLIGAKNAWGFDLNAACSGFLYALTTAAQFIQTGMHKRVIVIGADTMSSIINYEDRTTCVLFGDGAGGVLLEAGPEEFGVLDSALYGDGAGRAFLHMKAGGSLKPATEETVRNKEHFVYQEGKNVFKSAIRGMANAVREVQQRNGITNEDVAWLVPHQANMRIITQVAEMLDFPQERVMINIEKYGNTTAGTIPLCLWEWENRLKPGDNLILTAFGGGFTWGAILVRWSLGGN